MNGRWSVKRANDWYARQPWPVGTNFVPSTAINQLQMFGPDSFDPDTIDRELGWAAEIEMNSMRVFLHDRLWDQDADGFKRRLDRFLSIANSHGISTLLVLFDDCWHEPGPDPQPAPVPGQHNSGWARAPGKDKLLDRSSWGGLEAYVTDIARSFGQDERVLGWDIYNEVGNLFLPAYNLSPEEREAELKRLRELRKPEREAAFELLDLAFAWVRATAPVQPLTVGVWYNAMAINDHLIELSDIISFHNYTEAPELEERLTGLQTHGRPIWCTEYMARTRGSTFASHLPVFARAKVGAWNWGLVDGLTQTKYAWTDKPSADEPALWFHEVFRKTGEPYRREEVELIRRLTNETRAT